jgi:hypothetical protein
MGGGGGRMGENLNISHPSRLFSLNPPTTTTGTTHTHLKAQARPGTRQPAPSAAGPARPRPAADARRRRCRRTPPPPPRTRAAPPRGRPTRPPASRSSPRPRPTASRPGPGAAASSASRTAPAQWPAAGGSGSGGAMLRVGASYDSDAATRIPQFASATRSEVCIRAPSARVPSAIAADGIGRQWARLATPRRVAARICSCRRLGCFRAQCVRAPCAAGRVGYYMIMCDYKRYMIMQCTSCSVHSTHIAPRHSAGLAAGRASVRPSMGIRVGCGAGRAGRAVGCRWQGSVRTDRSGPHLSHGPGGAPPQEEEEGVELLRRRELGHVPGPGLGFGYVGRGGGRPRRSRR